MQPHFEDGLATYATRAPLENARFFSEQEMQGRSPFRRDRDRIVHAQAFRRLAHKTQVFISEEGDHFRTRLTHTIEVAQIARSLARNLGVDSDLCEALALSHDLGHTPFGHTGEDALNDVMAPYGGFEHNAQTLRIVTLLEQRYAAFDGLNLSREALDGIIKHNGPITNDQGEVIDPKLQGQLPFALTDFLHKHHVSADQMQLDCHAGLESQLAAISDDIAYNTHDIDDGVRAGLFVLDDLAHIPLARSVISEIDQSHPNLEPERRMGEFTRRLITSLIVDVDTQTHKRLHGEGIQTAEEVKNAGKTIGHFSDAVGQDVWMIKTFLFKTVYRNADMMQLRSEADRVLRELFAYYIEKPHEIPSGWQPKGPFESNPTSIARAVCDFVAGMTDRYALKLHTRLFDDTPDLRYGAAI